MDIHNYMKPRRALRNMKPRTTFRLEVPVQRAVLSEAAAAFAKTTKWDSSDSRKENHQYNVLAQCFDKYNMCYKWVPRQSRQHDFPSIRVNS